jgi:prophage regulatory protein
VTDAQADTSEDRIILNSERRVLVPYSDMQIWRMEKAGTFPKRIKLGPNRVGWILSEVLEWIENRKAEREAIIPNSFVSSNVGSNRA